MLEVVRHGRCWDFELRQRRLTLPAGGRQGRLAGGLRGRNSRRHRRSPGSQQILHHLPAGREPLLRNLRQRPGDRGAIGHRQRIQERRTLGVLGGELKRRGTGKRPAAGQHLLVDDRQTVLIAIAADAAVERFRGGIDHGHAGGRGCRASLQALHQAKIRQFDSAADQQQVLRLDIQVLKSVLLAHVIESVRRVQHVRQQLAARNTGQPGAAALREVVHEAGIRQFHDDDELIVNNLETFEGKDEGMPNLFDAAQRLELLLGAGIVHVAIDDLDRLGQAARGRRFPDFAVAARSQPLDQLVSRDRFGTRLAEQRHKRSPSRS